MAQTWFNQPIFVKRKHYFEEVAALEDAFDVLENWPNDERGIAYETVLNACHRAASGLFPIRAAEENFRRFIQKAGMLADIEEVPNFGTTQRPRNLGGH